MKPPTKAQILPRGITAFADVLNLSMFFDVPPRTHKANSNGFLNSAEEDWTDYEDEELGDVSVTPARNGGESLPGCTTCARSTEVCLC